MRMGGEAGGGEGGGRGGIGHIVAIHSTCQSGVGESRSQIVLYIDV